MKKLLLLFTAILLLTSCTLEQKAYQKMHHSYLRRTIDPASVSFASEFTEYATDSIVIIHVVVRDNEGRHECEYCYGIVGDETLELWKDLSRQMSMIDYAQLLLVNDGLEFPYTEDNAIRYVATSSLEFDGEKVR